jgi:hypothetical protein
MFLLKKNLCGQPNCGRAVCRTCGHTVVRVPWYGPVTRHILWFLQSLYGTGMVWAPPVETVTLTAVYRHHTGKYLSSTRAFYFYYNASGHSGRIFTHPRPSQRLTPLPYPHLWHPAFALSPAPNAKQRCFFTSSHPSTPEWASISTL